MTGSNEPLIVPEIHTTFKALRWLCDEKQIFDDGSFLHTMFLTIFYALALVEVYRSWDPGREVVAKLYDDVVWFSPIRTTPERSKRLAAELENSDLKDKLDRERRRAAQLKTDLIQAEQIHKKIIWIALAAILSFPLFLPLAQILKVGRLSYEILEIEGFLTLIGVLLTILIALITVIWKYSGNRYKS